MKTLFLDVDTQNDFVLPAGSLYVPGAEKVVPVVATLNRHAASRGFGLVSTACFHAENDPEFQEWPPHCIAGTVGQLKPVATTLGQRIFEKQHTDVFLDARWRPLLQELDAAEYYVYGVVTEVCVRFAAEGLLSMRAKVNVVSDAVVALNDALATEFFERFRSNGGVVTTSAELLSRN